MKLATFLGESSVSDFASLIGVTPKAVEHWLSARRTPRPNQMHKIVEVTGGAVTPNDFLPPKDAEAAE